MTTKEAHVRIAAVTSTLYESGGSCAASTIYLALGCDFGAWEALQHLLVSAGLVTVDASHRVSLTPTGEDIGRQCSELLAQASA